VLLLYSFELQKTTSGRMKHKLEHVLAGSSVKAKLLRRTKGWILCAVSYFCTYADVVGTGMKTLGSGTAGTVADLTPRELGVECDGMGKGFFFSVAEEP
jgi:hypothetical protein